MPVILIALLLAILPRALLADSCKFQRTLDRELDASPIARLRVDAAAGELRARGADPDKVTAHALLCSDSETVLARMDVEAKVNGTEGLIVTRIPDSNGRPWNGAYATIDLSIRLPSGLPLTVRDSSGDIDLRDVTVTSIEDSSGEIELAGSRGTLRIEDSSGEITVRDHQGDITLSDSSGDIRLEQIQGKIHIERDSSGRIDIADVTGDVAIDQDSSGDIDIDHVEGGVDLGRDGSGDISINRVRDSIRIGSDGSGDVRVADVGGDLIVEMKGDGRIRPTRVAGKVDTP